jgi:protein tyrosine phosphatase (PTP) superfamily phosphohydrolase (DUF442 family)
VIGKTDMSHTPPPPAPKDRPLTPLADLAQWQIILGFWLRDDAWVRVLLPNTYRVDANLWRSGHPSRARMAALRQAQGIKSVLSLRGDADNTPNSVERAAAKENGLDLRFIRLRTADLPSADTLRALLAHLREMPKPMLVHCKSGADRTGLAVTLYRHVIKGEPLAEARKALSWRYGHWAVGKAGVVHRLLDAYGAAHEETGIGFEAWLETGYDRDALMGRVKA